MLAVPRPRDPGCRRWRPGRHRSGAGCGCGRRPAAGRKPTARSTPARSQITPLACSITTRLVSAADSCSFSRWASALARCWAMLKVARSARARATMTSASVDRRPGDAEQVHRAKSHLPQPQRQRGRRGEPGLHGGGGERRPPARPRPPGSPAQQAPRSGRHPGTGPSWACSSNSSSSRIASLEEATSPRLPGEKPASPRRPRRRADRRTGPPARSARPPRRRPRSGSGHLHQ